MTKQEKIQKMLDMQKRFREKEQSDGVSMEEYLSPSEGSPLNNYRQEYMKLAMEIVDEAHEEVGSKR